MRQKRLKLPLRAKLARRRAESISSLDRLTKHVQWIGGIIAALVAVFGIFKAFMDWSNLNAQEVDRKLAAAIATYTTAADRAAKINLGRSPLERAMLIESYRQVVLQTPPIFKDTTIDLFRIGRPTPTEIYTSICAERQFALSMHIAAAGADGQAALEAALGELQKTARGDPLKTDETAKAASAIELDKQCRDLEIEAAMASKKAVRAAVAAAPSSPPFAAKATPEAGEKSTLDPRKPADKAAIVRNALNKRTVNPIGWDIDVFACAAGDRKAAQNFAETLSNAADSGSQYAGEPIGRVRLRPLAPDTPLARLAANGAVIVADPSEGPFADRLAEALPIQPHQTLSRVSGDGSTRWYLSVVVCGAPPT